MIIQKAQFQPSLTIAENRARGFNDNSMSTAGEFIPEEGIITTGELGRVTSLLRMIGVSDVADSYAAQIIAAQAREEDLLSIDAPNVALVARYSDRVGVAVVRVTEFPSSIVLTQKTVENPSLLDQSDANTSGRQGFRERVFRRFLDKMAA